MRIGINGSDKLLRPDIDEMLGDIEASEKSGFATYWLAQTGLVDALGVLALAGPRTSSIELGTAVVPTWTRHPQTVAAAGAHHAGGDRRPHDPRPRPRPQAVGRGQPADEVGEADPPHARLPRRAAAAARDGDREPPGRGVELHGQRRAADRSAAEGDAGRARRADAEDRRPPHRRHDPVVRRPDDARAPDRADHQRRRRRRRPTDAERRVQPAGVGDRRSGAGARSSSGRC